MTFWPETFPLFPDKASELAGQVDALFFVALTITAFFSLLIAVLILYFATRFRRRSPDEVGHPEKASTWLEVTWSVIPLGIVMFLFGWGTQVFFVSRRPPADAVEYFVTAKQWMWKVQHPEGNREINQLHVPRGQTIKLTMTSEDVIHSFFVPAFRMKTDVIPGRYTTYWFKADKVGTYQLFCTEYCGAEHSLMIGTVTVMEPDDYERWLAGAQSQAPPALSGEELFSSLACNTCHQPGSAARAPILNGLFGMPVEMEDGTIAIADENYLRQSILYPGAQVVKGYQPMMPTYKGRVSEEELVGLISYIKSLAADGAGHTEASAAADSPAATEG